MSKSLKEKIRKCVYEDIRCIELTPDEGCNLRCSYCTVIKDKDNSYSDETIDALVKLYKTNRNIEALNFFGGEPASPTSVKQTSKLLKKLKEIRPLFQFMISSNAYEVNDDVLEFYRTLCGMAHHGKVQLSLDGCREAHETHRYSRDGKSSFNNIIENIPKIAKVVKEVNPKVSVRIHCVITPKTVKYAVESFKFLSRLKKENEGLIDFITCDNEMSGMFGDFDKNELRKAMCDIIDEYINGNIDFSVIMDMFDPLTSVAPKNIGHVQSACGILSDHVTISPDGWVLPCHTFGSKRKDEYKMHNIVNGEYQEENLWIFSMLKANMKFQSGHGYDCSRCVCRSTCHACKGTNSMYNVKMTVQPKSICTFQLTAREVLIEKLNNGEEPYYYDHGSLQESLVFEEYLSYRDNLIKARQENHPDLEAFERYYRIFLVYLAIHGICPKEYND